jgi:hypothetical protein
MQVDLSDASQVEERQRQLASAFRGRMSEGVEFRRHNPYRQDFFKQVIQLASDVNFCVLHHFSEYDRFF